MQSYCAPVVCPAWNPSAGRPTARLLHVLFLFQGMAMGITGPTLLDLSIITRSSTDEIAFVFTSRAIGGFIGGIVASVAVNYVNNWVR